LSKRFSCDKDMVGHSPGGSTVLHYSQPTLV